MSFFSFIKIYEHLISKKGNNSEHSIGCYACEYLIKTKVFLKLLYFKEIICSRSCFLKEVTDKNLHFIAHCKSRLWVLTADVACGDRHGPSSHAISQVKQSSEKSVVTEFIIWRLWICRDFWLLQTIFSLWKFTLFPELCEMVIATSFPPVLCISFHLQQSSCL